MVLYTFTIVNIKKRPTLSTALHIVRTLVLSLWIMPFSAAYLLQQGSRNKTYVWYSDKINIPPTFICIPYSRCNPGQLRILPKLSEYPAVINSSFFGVPLEIQIRFCHTLGIEFSLFFYNVQKPYLICQDQQACLCDKICLLPYSFQFFCYCFCKLQIMFAGDC